VPAGNDRDDLEAGQRFLQRGDGNGDGIVIAGTGRTLLEPAAVSSAGQWMSMASIGDFAG
jgi:hypothetical protein